MTLRFFTVQTLGVRLFTFVYLRNFFGSGLVTVGAAETVTGTVARTFGLLRRTCGAPHMAVIAAVPVVALSVTTGSSTLNPKPGLIGSVLETRIWPDSTTTSLRHGVSQTFMTVSNCV